MTSKSRTSSALRVWYKKQVRPFLQDEEPDRIGEIDREIERLEAREKSLDEPMSACFVGGAGIGKSTLINAMVAGHEIVVPSGGVGPLTAQALQISYGETASFAAEYHPPNRMWRLGFALESMLTRQRKQAGIAVESDLGKELDEEELAEADTKELEPSEAASKSEVLRKQAQLLITGKQDSEYDLAYLVDSIREVLRKERIWGTVASAADSARVMRLKQNFDVNFKKAPSICERSASDANFQEELHDHAAGFLSPAIQELTVWWNSPLLQQGLQLIDLPGLGIAGDVYRQVTELWVKERAHVVVLVVTHRGVMESDAQLLRTSGFLTRLLHSIDDPTADPISLIIAVVKTDEIAESRREQDKSKKTREHLAEVMDECRSLVQSQIRDRIAEVWNVGGDSIAEGKNATIHRILDGLRIYPVSAKEYRKLMADDDEVRTFLSTAEESGVPAMVDGLAEMATHHLSTKQDRFIEAVVSLQGRLTNVLELIRARWEERTRAKEEAEDLRRELDSFLKPLREEFRARQGGFRTFLKDTLPKNIENVVLESSLTASKSIRSYLRTLRDAHWKTLQAAVRREGTYYGRKHINLPSDFAQAFEDPVAELWSKSILTDLRKRTSEFSKDCLGFVDKIVEWAKEQGGRVQPRLIEAQRDAIASDTKHLATVGKEVVNELRDRVKTALSKAIEGPIRKKCKKFVDDNAHVGTGVRDRILNLFDELADVAVEAARSPAQKVLLENYNIVEKEISDAWQNHGDPLASAADAIVASHEDSIKRSDAQKRKAVLAQIDSILEAQPSE